MSIHQHIRKKRADFPLFGKKQAFANAIIISFILNFVLILGGVLRQTQGVSFLDMTGGTWGDYVKYFLWHFLCNVALFYLLFLFNFKVIRSRLKNRFPWSAIFGTLLICLLISPILSQIQWHAIGGGKGLVNEQFVIYNLIKDTILGIIVLLLARNIYSNHKREQALIANQKLREENIRVRFEALKNQLDPHFLFNSLNTLNGLIGIDDEKAREYVDNLSFVFRYTLRSKELLTLDEELEFVKSYAALLKIRFGDNLTVEYDIDDRCWGYQIMPVSIQLLVENAVKHNEISNRNPLLIRIATTPEESVVVSNRINPKAEKSLGGGVGLANLEDRYAILFKKSIAISYADQKFSVEIPLMKETEKYREL